MEPDDAPRRRSTRLAAAYAGADANGTVRGRSGGGARSPPPPAAEEALPELPDRQPAVEDGAAMEALVAKWNFFQAVLHR
ncbi:hypothetical protein Rsub_10365 [Raphidocelis subcapitata]|uniref:Uncharacterized protein n=1 Tax=Raphidocelis subcapitata TaxID=307507 RepID=A0A2V0PEP5_9CHLO|nr:hypothetical protein Rsub_10365 [Raphidocelis subcapitata]|eukprot:GBF97442.1 hypothetical protein Rsub_10365 [Raphidocelis subcapitata]